MKFYVAYGKCSVPGCNEVTIWVIPAKDEVDALRKYGNRNDDIRHLPDPTDELQIIDLSEENLKSLPRAGEEE